MQVGSGLHQLVVTVWTVFDKPFLNYFTAFHSVSNSLPSDVNRNKYNPKRSSFTKELPATAGLKPCDKLCITRQKSNLSKVATEPRHINTSKLLCHLLTALPAKVYASLHLKMVNVSGQYLQFCQ